MIIKDPVQKNEKRICSLIKKIENITSPKGLIKSFQELHRLLIKNNKNNGVYNNPSFSHSYRGQGDYAWKLQSTWHREYKRNVTPKEFNKYLENIYNRQPEIYINKNVFLECKNLDIMTQHRHLGGYSPFVDFSYDYKTSLYFAARNENPNDGAIYIFQPFDSHAGRIENYKDNEIRIQHIGGHIQGQTSSKHFKQSSCYLIAFKNTSNNITELCSPHEYKKFNNKHGEQDFLNKIRIRSALKERITKILDNEHNINKNTMFPEGTEHRSESDLLNDNKNLREKQLKMIREEN